MTDDHLGALLTVAEGKKEKDGWFTLPEGRHITLYVAFNGASLSVSKISHVKRDGALLLARTVKEESYILAIDDVYAGSVEAPASSGRKAGFG
jgi:hypothetical protein